MINFRFALRNDLVDRKEFLPTKGEPYASGYDVRAALHGPELKLYPGNYFKIPLGFRAFPPEGWWFYLHPRSSSFTKKYIHNLVGIIDEHYSNEVLLAGHYLPENNDVRIIKFGEPLGQIIPVKTIDMVVNEIDNKEYDDLCKQRFSVRQGGFGSTEI